jgi:GNAT superfamily N-acetyltransferase
LPNSELFASQSLSQRLERAEAMANAAYIESRAKLAPAVMPEWIDVSGTYAMFDTPDSPVTQTFGLGMFGEVTAADLNRLEAFFASHAAPVYHEISPLADPSVWPLIADRRYTPFEFTSVLYLDLRNARTPEPSNPNGVQVRAAALDEREAWARTAAAGWGQSPVLGDFMQTVFNTQGVTPFIAEKDGNPIATGALNMQNGVALLAGASTIPEARQQGAQRALLAARLQYAAEAGCEIAAMGAQPGSASQRNAERSGFRIAYTRTKWRLAVQ